VDGNIWFGKNGFNNKEMTSTASEIVGLCEMIVCPKQLDDCGRWFSDSFRR